MAARKKKQKVVESVPGEAEAALPSLTQEELLTLRLHDSQVKLFEQTARALLFERSAYIARIDPQNRIELMDQQIRRAREQENENRRSYTETLRAASVRVGIDLGVGCSIDPATGKIIQHEAKEQQ
jgi:hypothetical protein